LGFERFAHAAKASINGGANADFDQGGRGEGDAAALHGVSYTPGTGPGNGLN